MFGIDIIARGAGNDTFAWNAPTEGGDNITDFKIGEPSRTDLLDGDRRSQPFFDADGNGGGAAVLIAHINVDAVASDFHLVFLRRRSMPASPWK
jgi:hypothetical protein